MRFSLSLALAAHLAAPSHAFVPASVRSNAALASDHTSPTARSRSTLPPFWKSASVTTFTSSTSLFYELSNDANDGSGAARKLPNAWSVLADTEKWMSMTLKEASDSGNPLSRKEVSYVCETSNDSAMILANVFRKLKEFRLLGEKHGSDQENLVQTEGESHKRTTLRQTQVLVIPANGDLNESFKVFDELVNAINQARRSARDYITDHSLEKLDDHMYGDGDRDWSVSVNFAHLHPKFGEQTPEEKLKELQDEETNGEVDLNYQEYKERKMQARRSPYPSVVVEVRATPPPDFSAAKTPPQPSGPRRPESFEDDDDLGYQTQEVTADFIQRLEALFAKSAHIKDAGDTKKKDDFYDSIGSHIEEVSAVTPMSLAQTWIAANDPMFGPQASSFTMSETQHVDEAYEFVFTNLAMQTSQYLDNGVSPTVSIPGAAKRQYMVMSRFLTSSATSFEKFSREVLNIIQALPVLKDRVELSCLHPEHIDAAKRSPVPVFVMQWKD